MGSEMTPERAAQKLDERLRSHNWYLSTGVGTTAVGEALFVYVKSQNHPELKTLGDRWMGYDLLIRKVGSILPYQPIKAMTVVG